MADEGEGRGEGRSAVGQAIGVSRYFAGEERSRADEVDGAGTMRPQIGLAVVTTALIAVVLWV